MVAASFLTLIYWTLFGLVACYLMFLVGAELERRKRVRQMRERRLRRRNLNALPPEKWNR